MTTLGLPDDSGNSRSSSGKFGTGRGGPTGEGDKHYVRNKGDAQQIQGISSERRGHAASSQAGTKGPSGHRNTRVPPGSDPASFPGCSAPGVTGTGGSVLSTERGRPLTAPCGVSPRHPWVWVPVLAHVDSWTSRPRCGPVPGEPPVPRCPHTQRVSSAARTHTHPCPRPASTLRFLASCSSGAPHRPASGPSSRLRFSPSAA